MLTILEYFLVGIFLAVFFFASRWLGQQAYTWMPPQATAEAERVDALFSFLVSLGAFVFLCIVGIIVYSLLFYRSPTHDFSEGHPMRGSWKIETLWTVVPIILVLWIAAQGYRIYEQLDILGLTPIVLHLHLEEPVNAASKPEKNNDAKPASEEIEVNAKQWLWTFRYPKQDKISKTLHLPVNQSVRLVMHSQDVIHGFYIPEFRVKQDIIPNRTITFVVTPTRVGQYILKDSQFSGENFALMETKVFVEPPDIYQQWLDQGNGAS